MSNAALTWAWSVPLPPPQKLVLLRLADTARDDGSKAWRSLEKMQTETGLGRRTILRALSALTEDDLIEQVVRPCPGRVAEYRLRLGTDHQDAEAQIDGCHPDTRTGAALAPDAGTGAAVAPERVPETTATGAAVAPPPYSSQKISQKKSANAHAHARETAEAMLAIFVEELGETLPTPRKLTAERVKAAAARLRDSCGGDLEGWREACRQVRRSSFLTGGGNRGWRADWDWLLKPTNLMKISEGKYDDQPGAASARHHGGRIDRMNAVDQVFDAIRAGRGEER